MVQFTNVIVASALVASAFPAFAAPVAQDIVDIEARQSRSGSSSSSGSIGKAVIDLATDPAARYTITKSVKDKAKKQAIDSNKPRPNNGGFLNSEYNSQRKSKSTRRELDEEEFFAREFDEQYLEARQTRSSSTGSSGSIGKKVIDLATDPAARYTITKSLKDKAKKQAIDSNKPRPNNGGFLNSEYNSQRKSKSTRRELDEEEFFARKFDEQYLEARQSRSGGSSSSSGGSIGKKVIDLATDPAARYTITKSLKDKAKKQAIDSNKPRPNNGGFLNSEYNSQRKSKSTRRELDEEAFFAREFDEQYLEARQARSSSGSTGSSGSIGKKVIDLATDPAARYTITKSLKDKAKKQAIDSNKPRPNNGGFLNSEYNSQRKSKSTRRELDSEEEGLLERGYYAYDELDLD